MREPNASGQRNGDAAAVRTFFALWPDAGAAEALATLAHGVADRMQGRAAAAGNLHMTLAFLGDVATARIGGLHSIGAAVAAAASPFALTLDRIGTFRGAGIAWAGTSAPPPGLESLVRQLGDLLSAGGFAIERRAFHPHVTLARRCRRPVGDAAMPPLCLAVVRITLNASELASGGSRYRELGGWSLGPRAGDDRAS